MSLRDDLLPLVDELRALPGEFGFRPMTSVVLRTRTWSGAEPGDGTHTDANLALTTGGQPAKVAQLSSREVQASAGRYTDADFKIGPLTPSFTREDATTGGYTPAELAPSSSARNVERHVILTGPGESASEWIIVGETFTTSFRYSLVIRRTERVA